MRLRRVLFVCIGNSCRSQMAEGFARTYGRSVMVAKSAGLAPASMVSPVTRQIMRERNIDLGEAFPKALDELHPEDFDLLINMSGHPIHVDGDVEVREWVVRDPISLPDEAHRQVRDQIESLVQQLIVEMEKRRQWSRA